jgi:hypothetical protein
MAGIIFTKQSSGVFGDKRFWLGTIAFDSDNFPTGGELVTKGDFEFQVAIEGVMVGTGSALVTTRTLAYDPSTEKITIIIQDGSPIESATDESAIVDVQVLALGY